MKRNETPGSSTSQPLRAQRHEAGSYQKVTDARKRPVRGLWRRNDRFYAQLTIVDPNTGQKSVRRVPLVDEETKAPVTTAPQAIAALEKLKVRRDDGALPVLRRCPKFSDYVEEYLEKIAAGDRSKRPATIDKERYSLARWKAHFGDTPINHITKPMIIAFRDKRQAEGKKPRTLNLDIIALRNVLNRAVDDGWLKVLPLENFRPLKAVSKRRPLVTLPDIERICDAAFKPLYFEDRLARQGEAGRPLKNAQQFADYMRLMALCGSRRDETLRLKWCDVDFGRRQLTIGADGLPKNHETRSVDFHPRLEALLREMETRRAPDSAFLFPSPQRGDKDASSKTFKESLKLARAAAGLPLVAFHDCRHCFISFGVMSGIDFMTLAKWAGHKDGGILIGKVYGHLADEHRRTMADKFSFGPVVMSNASNQ